ncbi:hypothetical protein Ciccas_001560 [Cichlidogyrus casuarinus]|uniref:Uncharacterized protein n=1 Tax=Cichlidogyrus casuarinus TaxID=1844966 RepID=A0ABD2QK87_9PLAT
MPEKLDNSLHSSFRKLLSLVKSLSPQDLGVKDSWTAEATHFQAPVLYIHIMENETFSIGMCRSFTRVSVPDAKLSKFSSVYKRQLSNLHSVRLCQDTLITDQSEPCLLTPSYGNLHEITVVGDSAIFLDILAPPYDHDLDTRLCTFYKEVDLPILGSTSSAETNQNHLEDPLIHSSSGDVPISYLIETHPSDYWCESDQYSGPSLEFSDST